MDGTCRNIHKSIRFMGSLVCLFVMQAQRTEGLVTRRSISAGLLISAYTRAACMCMSCLNLVERLLYGCAGCIAMVLVSIEHTEPLHARMVQAYVATY